MIAILDTPCGRLWIRGDFLYVREISWNPVEGETHTAELDWIVSDLSSYFSNRKRSFGGSLAFHGQTPVWSRQEQPFKPETFYQKVLSAMVDIPYGEVRAYSEIARVTGNPDAARAVGNACGKNPLPVIVPCHRVVGKHSIGGFSSGVHRKEILLNLEKIAEQR